MTYCVGVCLEKGLVFMSDTRTNAGVDNVFTFRKMFTWEVPGERVITLMTAGNLATTQAVVSLLNERMKAPEDRQPGILQAETMFQVAKMVGGLLRDTVQTQSEKGPESEATFSATIIVGGQIAGAEPRLFLIYPEGNFIEASDENPFFQIGEAKYGRPVLLRGYDPSISFEDAVKLLLLSFDSTLKANLSVGMPLDLLAYETDSLNITGQQRIEEDDPYFTGLSKSWGEVLNAAIRQLPPFSFASKDS
ncbi:peptidase [Hyphobacterium sp.]|uniref:peptidase n=1 Tax=Hyphobacterium sp. TaxID=2004662 RepID=UPI003BAA724B